MYKRKGGCVGCSQSLWEKVLTDCISYLLAEVPQKQDSLSLRLVVAYKKLELNGLTALHTLVIYLWFVGLSDRYFCWVLRASDSVSDK